MGVVMLISLYTTRVVLNVLGVVDYGIYNVVCGFVSMFGVFNTCLNTATNRYYNFAIGKKEKEGVRKVFNASLRIQLLLVIVTVILVETIGVWYINEKMVIPTERLGVANWIFQFAVISLIFVFFQTPYSAVVIAYEKMDYYAIVSIADAVIKLGFVLWLKFVDWDKLHFYGMLMVVLSFINFFMYFSYSKLKFLEMKFDRRVDKDIFKSMFLFSSWSLLDPITLMLKGQGSNMVLNVFFGPVVNAAYGVSNQISNAIHNFTSNISVAFRPQMVQSYSAQEYNRTKNLMYGMSKINFILHSIVAIPVIFELKFILELWLGKEYPDYTIPFTIFTLIISTLNCLHAPISIVMVATGKIKKIKTMSLIIIGLVVPIGFVCFKIGFPPIAIFISLLLLTIVNIIVSAQIMCKKFPTILFYDYLKNIFLRCILFFLLITPLPFIIVLLLPSSWLRVVILLLLSFITSIVIGFHMVLNKEEQGLVRSYVNSFVNKI